MKLLPASLLFGCSLGTPTITQWQFEIEDTVYEALVHPVPRGFWESKAFCDGFGAGWQLPIPSNDAEVSFMFNLLWENWRFERHCSVWSSNESRSHSDM